MDNEEIEKGASGNASSDMTLIVGPELSIVDATANDVHVLNEASDNLERTDKLTYAASQRSRTLMDILYGQRGGCEAPEIRFQKNFRSDFRSRLNDS